MVEVFVVGDVVGVEEGLGEVFGGCPVVAEPFLDVLFDLEVQPQLPLLLLPLALFLLALTLFLPALVLAFALALFLLALAFALACVA
ncbi:hypothetical protein QMO46_08390, partial [Microbacterium barkeri]|uniref:hypothetical protein n=1 Tax=Microbacterium barkeri TaxID=33917 RepID=UPI0024AEA484